MASFNYQNPTTSAKTSIFDCLRGAQASELTTQLKINSAEQTTYGIPISNSYADLPEGWAGPLLYEYNGTDIGLRFGPRGYGTSTSGTHTLHPNCTKFLIMAVGGGGGGGRGGTGAVAGTGGTCGNTGTGGRCVYAGYPVVSGQNTITFTIGFNGAPRLSGGDTVVSYDGREYVRARGGPGGADGVSQSYVAYDADYQPYMVSPSSLNNATQITSTVRTEGRFGFRDYAGTFQKYTSRGPFTAANNSGFETAQVQPVRYINTSSAGFGYGGSGGTGSSTNTSGTNGTSGKGGWVSIFEYFN